MKVLELEGLCKDFETSPARGGRRNEGRKIVHAVKDLSFSVEKGEILAFLGPNGAGKSTTIKLITGILTPTRGKIQIMGKSPKKNRKELAMKIGTVFGQKSQLWYHLPADDSFQLLGAIYRIPKKELNRRIGFLSEVFELEEFIVRPVRKLSLGQRIRCEIAASLLHQPEMLFLDEPTIGLDVVVRERVRNLIRRINEEEGVTIFLTSHDAGDVEKLCRRALVINRGERVWDGSVKDMKYRLLNKRILDIKAAGLELPSLPGTKILKQNPYSIKIEADLDKIELSHLVGKLLAAGEIQDISINPPPMEEIITRIYEETHP